MTLQELLATKVPSKDNGGNDIQLSPEFRVAVQQVESDGIHFIIHPDGYSGETLDFIVRGDELTPV